MSIVYSTETPIIARAKHHFNYPCKRDAYTDCCKACYALNQAAKMAPDNYRHYLYRLKHRWVEKLYKQGFCVQAYEEYSIIHFKFKVDGIVFAWHLPEQVASWPIKENRQAFNYEWRDEMRTWTGSLEEAIALLEWVLG